MSILIKGIPLGGYEISIMKDGERYRARVDGIWCEVEEIPTTEPDTDTISRTKAIAEAEKARAYVWHRYNIESMVGRDIFEMLDNVGLGISKLPPAQPEPKRGKWIKISPANIYECSECGKSVMTNDICAYDFCHGCGAKMESEVTE